MTRARRPRPWRPDSSRTFATPDSLPTYALVPVKGPQGEVLDAYRGVQREDTGEVISVVSARYGLVAHRDVAHAVHAVGKSLEAPATGEMSPTFPRESIRLYSGERRMEVKLVVGRRFRLGGGEEVFPGLRVLNSLDGSWAVRLSGFAVRLACTNQLYAPAGNVLEWRELHLSSENDLLSQLDRAIHAFLDRFPEGLDLYVRAMGEHVLASEIEPALRAQGVPPRHSRIIGARVEVEASHVAELSRWAAYQVATAYLTREVEVNPDRERFFERAAARAILLPSPGSGLGSASA